MSFLGKALFGLGLKSDNDVKPVTNKRVATRSTKTTSEASVQVGVLGLKAEQRMIAELRRLRARVQPRDETSQSTSRLASESEDYHIGKVISKLLKPEKKATTSANESHTCSVCLEELSTANTNMTKTSCGHVFHLSCLLKSLTTKNKCPMCRSDLEDPRPAPSVSNLLTPASAEQLIVEEISYFPNASHTQSITLSRHPKRRVKEMLRVFGFALLRATAQFVHDENMPEGWYDDSESTDSDDDDETENEEENQEEPDGYSSDNTAVAGDEWRPLPPQNQDLRFSLDEVHQAAFNAFR